ncbi:MAG: YqeG family HAD IIIA-type phosphatase [Clostridia bacterium]|nr:YqeG family HAD IIIA-type phosphatase [Clostridia bacterium]
MPLLFPTILKNRITELTPQELDAMGVKALLLDVDNTLTRHHSQELDDGVAAWLASMRDAGVQMRLVSNSKKPRVDPFAKRIGLDYEHTSMKPLPFGFFRAAKAMGVSRRECLVIGDQTFTDVLGAKLAGVRVLQLLPIEEETMWSFRVRRRLEKRVLARYQRRQNV